MGRHPGLAAAEAYGDYLGAAMSDPWTSVLLEYAAPRPCERVLDIACGTGSVARRVAPMVGVNTTVIGLDISLEMLAVARSLPVSAGASIKWLEANAIALPLPDGMFDLVLCQQGLQFFSDPARSLREMRRVLVQRGRVALSVWQALRYHPVYEALFYAIAHRLDAAISDVALSFSLPDEESLRELLIGANFQRVEVASESLNIHLPSAERFVELTVLGAATTIPAFAKLDSTARSTLVETVSIEIEAVTNRYRNGKEIVFPMSTHIALASAE